MKTNLESITWKGGRGRFENLAKSSQLKRGYIYFVGDYSGSELGGLEQSKSGVIYVATSERSYVTFGTFDLKDLEKRITEIEQRLEELGGNIDELIKEVVTLYEEVVTLGGKVSEIGSKVSTIEKGAEKNKINVVERNGQAITPSEDKVINILVPVNTSELNNDSKYQTDADVAETIIGANLNVASGIITLTRKNGTTFTIDLPTEKIIKSGYYDSTSEEIVLVLADDSEIRFNASQLIDEYYADNVTLEQYTDTTDGNKKKFRLTTSYKNKIDGSEQTSNKTSSVTSSSTATQYPSSLAVWNAIKDFATNVQTFTQATTRANIESGETISTIFGKIKKWFADLKTVAFSGSYNDLGDKPTIGSLAKLEPNSNEESFADTQKIIASPSNGVWGGTSYSKTALMMWNYINNKIESVLGLTASNYNGTADKANKDGSGDTITNTYLKLSGGTMTGNVKNKEGNYVSLIPSKQYSSYYLQFMKITYVGSNLDIPIEIRLFGRGSHQYIIQVNNSNSAPSGVTFYTIGNSIGSANGIYYKYDSTTKTLSLMFHHGGGGGWEAACVSDVVVPNNHFNKFSFDYTITEVSSTSGWTKASQTTLYYAISERANRDGNGLIISDNYTISTSNFTESISIHQFWQELRTKPSKIGSVLLSNSTGVGSQIKGGWYNFIFMPHYTNSGVYGSILITPMSVSNARRPEAWILQIENNTSSITNVLRLSNQQGGYYDVLEINDSNLSEYYTKSDSMFEILTIPLDIETVVFNTTSAITISAIQIPNIFNGKRITLIGQSFSTSEHLANTSTDGRFSEYLYEHRYGQRGGNGQSSNDRYTYEQYLYFKGIWYSKGY